MNTKALTDFVVAQNRAESAAERVLLRIKHDFGYTPASIQYPHVGTAQHVAQLLEEIAKEIGA